MDSNKVQVEEDSIDLLEILEVLRRNLWIILICTVAAAVAGFVVVSVFATPMYESSSMLLVISQQNDNNNNINTDQLNSAARLVETYSVIIRSRTILEPVIDTLDLDYTYNELVEMVSVSSKNDTSILQITVTSPDNKEAYDICKCITETAPDIVKDIANAGFVNRVEDASMEEEPVSPHVSRDTVIMGLLGAVLSIAVIVVIHLFDNKLNTEADVAKYLNIPVLGVIPYYEKEKKQ